ncbi:hypothetical protein WH52_12985 [Tenacibaculum holothuriorum]|uniref:DUF4296 domain-containing protein n=1 Tax=Tenacibaculum holothuriorum TaxID=1635173 RepID=A0A1Y2P9Q8_9FLAO|nr:DUF4296 domain-containing protein [Tenacibaculum holothuriorum]OSY87172.1 hypothetical protein WH52_12985 [Tenacibaculum holothuriorum]
MKKQVTYLLALILTFVSCTSNTIYEKPKDLIPKDSMISLLTDMYIAVSAKNIKDSLDKKRSNYTLYIYEKYKIDSTRFINSNTYYTSEIDEYTKMIKEVKNKIEELERESSEIIRKMDSLIKVNKKRKPPLNNLDLNTSKKNSFIVN